ncbi:L-aspartate oxidase [Sesbania bispinosa]|nr:L-aspartate oxidase [Sesbania bispinosa]
MWRLFNTKKMLNAKRMFGTRRRLSLLRGSFFPTYNRSFNVRFQPLNPENIVILHEVLIMDKVHQVLTRGASPPRTETPAAGAPRTETTTGTPPAIMRVAVTVVRWYSGSRDDS